MSGALTGGDVRLIGAALAGILLAVLMIVRGRLHPFIGLLCGAFTVGLLAGLPRAEWPPAVREPDPREERRAVRGARALSRMHRATRTT